MSPKSMLLLLALLTPLRVLPQAFTEMNPGIEGVNQGEITWVDYDNDDDLDVFIFGGGQNFSYYSYLYQNNQGIFTKVFPTTFTGIVIGDCDWGDYDNDGDLDLVISGSQTGSPSTGITKVYKNTGVDFVEANQGQIAGFIGSAVAWGDYDADGDLDLAIGGEEALTTSNNPRDLEIYKNDNNNFVRMYRQVYTGINLGSVDWGDYDKDGDLDLLATGFTFNDPAYRTSHIVDKTPAGFVRNENIILVGVGSGKGTWGDYDKDGDLDIIVNGSTYVNSILDRTTRIYQNIDGAFQEVLANKIIGTEEGQASWGDYDEDGDLDVVVIGRPTDNFSNYAASLYEFNNNTYTFVENLGSGVRIGSLSWGDYDNDGDLDILIAGQTDSPATITRLYVNNRKSGTFAKNQSPSVPANLRAEILEEEIKLLWDASSDTETTQQALTYAFYLRLDSDTIFSAQARRTGARKVDGAGNAGALTTFTIPMLPPGLYHWGVQAIDNSFKGSTFSTEDVLDIPTIVDVQKNTEEDELLIFPNPAVDNVTVVVRNSNIGKVQLALFSAAGEEVFYQICSKDSYEFKHAIEPSNLSSGFYLLRITHEGGQSILKKIVIP
jgi:hypothetical protein